MAQPICGEYYKPCDQERAWKENFRNKNADHTNNRSSKIVFTHIDRF